MFVCMHLCTYGCMDVCSCRQITHNTYFTARCICVYTHMYTHTHTYMCMYFAAVVGGGCI